LVEHDVQHAGIIAARAACRSAPARGRSGGKD
jgi:hypothetical protein